MSDDLRSRLNELETTVDALTDEVVELQQRLDEVEGDGGKKDTREEVGVGTDSEEDNEDDDTGIDTDDDIRVA
jgi:hypothetical protein